MQNTAILLMLFDRSICQMFGADAAAAKRTKESVAINVLRNLIFTPLSVVALSFLTGGTLLWFTVGIAEAVAFLSAMAITKHSEQGDVKFEKD